MSAPSTHPRDMRARIWRAILSATDQEIRDGLDFYNGAYGLCRMFAGMFVDRMPWLTISHVAGVYAALSPMNGWEENVSNVLDVLRWQSVGGGVGGIPYDLPRVNTPNPNLQKALKIAAGAEPLDVLRGDKVRAFYRGVSNPDDRVPIPVDRHLLTLACGVTPTKNGLSRMASDRILWSKVEAAYRYVGDREKETHGGLSLGNRVASIAWFVQRRALRGQQLLLQPSAYVCCQKPMHANGGRQRRVCAVCGKSVSYSALLPRQTIDGFKVSHLGDRKIVHIGKSHPYANSGGWQYVSRYNVMKELGRRLTTDEHVDHVNLNKQDERLENYQLLLAESHGQRHTYIAELAGWRGVDGRFVEHEESVAL